MNQGIIDVYHQFIFTSIVRGNSSWIHIAYTIHFHMDSTQRQLFISSKSTPFAKDNMRMVFVYWVVNPSLWKQLGWRGRDPPYKWLIPKRRWALPTSAAIWNQIKMRSHERHLLRWQSLTADRRLVSRKRFIFNALTGYCIKFHLHRMSISVSSLCTTLFYVIVMHFLQEE